ncbi:MAG: elongation factor Ts [Mogibacterium sp.]|nr:elongation factor Ts [Mogibacterium sp.]
MAEVTAKLVKELREMTGAGMMDCKKALVEAEADLEKAVEILREKGLSKAAKKAGRIAAMGLVRVALAEDGKTAAIVEVNSETDFVAKNDEFIDFVEGLARLALEADSNDMEAFKAMPFEGSTVGEVLTAKIAKIGENMSIRRIDKASGKVLATYIHGGGNIGVIVAAEGADNDADREALKNVAMQVAAMNPQYVSRDEISEDELSNLRKITLESALNDPFTLPKPILNGLLDKVEGVWGQEDVDILTEKRADKGFNFNYLPNFLSDEAKTRLAGLAIAAKMEITENKIFTGLVDGRIKKQLKEMCLLDQTYVRAEDGKQTVAEYLKSVDADLKLTRVIRFEVGEGIEKKEENFAEEVAAQLK